jgi:hypothetical protein
MLWGHLRPVADTKRRQPHSFRFLTVMTSSVHQDMRNLAITERI